MFGALCHFIHVLVKKLRKNTRVILSGKLAHRMLKFLLCDPLLCLLKRRIESFMESLLI